MTEDELNSALYESAKVSYLSRLPKVSPEVGI